MIVSVCGLGYTGSGAVWDLLKEYSAINVISEEEFGLLYRPDGILDLQYHLLIERNRYMGCDTAINRFKSFVSYNFRTQAGYSKKIRSKILMATDSFLDSLCQVKWMGYWGIDGQNITLAQRILIKLFPNLKRKILSREMFLSVNPENFNDKVKSYVEDILQILGYRKDLINIVNQGCSGDNSDCTISFFQNAKAIIVKKDPRDLYVLCKKEIKEHCSWIPTDNVDDFIKYIKAIYTFKSRQLVIDFEDLIYEYEETKSLIENYLGINPNSHKEQKKYFNPEVSINNTQLFRKYPDLEADIIKIEKELSEFLFDFSKYPIKTTFGESF